MSVPSVPRSSGVIARGVSVVVAHLFMVVSGVVAVGGVTAVVVLVDEGVPAAAGDQVAVRRICDGAGNEEREPDVRYVWRPADDGR